MVVRETSDTIPKLFLQQYENCSDKTKEVVHQKDRGIWQSYTWKAQYETVKYFSLGLVSLGLESGDKVSIVGDSDRHWYWSRWSIMSAGGTAVGMYADSIPSELKYIASHSDSKFVIADDQEQVDKILQIRDELPRLKKVIYWDPKGLGNYDEPILISYGEVIELGKRYEQQHPRAFEENIARGKADDVAFLVYTSGTSAEPKGAILTHKNILASVAAYNRSEPFYDTDRFFASPLPAWIAGPLFSVWVLATGSAIFYPEEPETLQADTREVAPDVVFYGARFWESIASTVLARMVDAPPLKKSVYFLFLPVGYKMAHFKMEDKAPSLLWETLYQIANALVFGPLRDKLGLSRTRVGITAGAMTSPDTFKFFHAIGINLKQSYGLTEAIPITHHRSGDIDFETLGSIASGNEVRVKDTGEIIARGSVVFPGYYRMQEKTKEVLKDGWFYTGDAGHINENGHIVYLDRVAELRELVSGEVFAPQYIESRLRFSPYIKDAMVIGDKKVYVTVLINIDFENCARWAEANKIVYTTFSDLSQKPEIFELIRKDVGRVNRNLPEHSRIKKFANLHKELDPDEAELTRTRKLRRGFLEERYRDLIEALYQDKKEFHAESAITYRDGRKGTISTVMAINSMDLGE